MKYKNVILTLHFTLQDENKWKRKMWRYRQKKIKKPRLFHVWLFDVDLTMCKLNKRPIIFEMQSNIALKLATWMAICTMVMNKQ